jgi:hypothetical protein
MQMDFSGLELFLEFWAGQATARQVLDHPAYQAVCEHARRYADGLSVEDLEAAVQGRPSPFYGLEGLPERLPQVRALAATLREQATAWLGDMRAALAATFSAEDLGITVYPIIGYDMGVGLAGVACLNLNCPRYLADPEEFLFYAIHECTHVLYERHHAIRQLAQVTSPAEWRAYFNLWLQNEGYAVYAPLGLRQARGRLDEQDYRLLGDPRQLEQHRRALLVTLDRLDQDQPLSRDEYLEACFGDQRLTYRMGCELIRRIERDCGPLAVRSAFYLDGDRFVNQYRRLLANPVEQKGRAND